MFSIPSIQRKVFIALLGFSAIFILGLGLISYFSGHSSLVDAIVSDLASAAHEKEKAINQWNEQRLEILVAISGSSDVSKILNSLISVPPEAGDAGPIRELIKQKIATWVGPDKPFNSMLVIAKGNGEVIFSSDEKEMGTFKENREYFIKGLKAPAVIGPYYSISRSEAVISAAAPFKNDNGLVAGILVARLNLDEITTIMQRRGGVNQTFDAYLVNTARLFVSQPREVLNFTILTHGIHLPFVDRCLKGESGSAIVNDFRGVPVIAAYRWSREIDLCVVAKLDQSEAFRTSRLFGWITLGGGIFMMIVAGFVAVFLSKWFTKPVLMLHGATRAVGSGDLGVRLEPKGRDEIAQLMHGFNEMVSSLAAKDQKIAEYTVSLENRVEERTADLIKSEENYRNLVTQMHDGLVVSVDQKVSFANQAFADMTGYSIDELAGKHIFDLVTPEQVDLLRKRHEDRLAGKDVPTSYEMILRNKDGKTETTCIVNTKLFKGSDNTLRVLGTFKDITSLKNTEAKLRHAQKMEALGNLTSGTAHTLNNLLQPILSLGQLLKRELRIGSDQREMIDYILDATFGAKDLVGRMLLFSRQDEPQRRLVDIFAVTQKSIALLDKSIPRTATIRKNLESKTGTVFADPVQIETIIMNLVTNATAAQGSKVGEIAVSLSPVEIAEQEDGAGNSLAAGSYAKLIIADNGPGMEEDVIERIFDPFFTTKDVGEGTGLGLSMVHGIIQRHDGHIGVSSKVGEGTTFEILLPIIMP